jgi:uncharacterized repeat protein (TIGR03803 family)
MTNSAPISSSATTKRLKESLYALAFVCTLVVLASQPSWAQMFTVLHTFTSGGDGEGPGGLILRGDNLYGAATAGGLNGSGNVFKLTHAGSGWLLNPLYQFSRINGDLGPDGAIVFGPDGSLYGAVGTLNGYGAIFKLQPPPSACQSALCYWKESELYHFADAPDGHQPNGNLLFDAAGNIYGTTETGGAFGFGTVFKLTRSGSSWTETVLYSFMGGSDGNQPQDGVVMDSAGNLYGTTRSGGESNCSGGCGTVFELSPSGGGWTEQVIYQFRGPPNGYEPWVGLTIDSSGKLYGSTYAGGNGGGGTVFELSLSGGTWNFNVIYNIVGNGRGPRSRLTVDAAGNLYGTFLFPPTLFKLSPSGGGWRYTDLHNFSSSDDGTYPGGNLAIDSQGNVYGTCSSGGQDLYGTAWELTP